MIFLNWHERVECNGGKSDITIRTNAPPAEVEKLIAQHGFPDSIVIVDERTERTRLYRNSVEPRRKAPWPLPDASHS